MTRLTSTASSLRFFFQPPPPITTSIHQGQVMQRALASRQVLRTALAGTCTGRASVSARFQARALHASSGRLDSQHPRAGSFQSSPKSSSPTSPSSSSAAAASKPTPTLHSLILESIKASGPMPVSTYMRTALLDPSLGYYAAAAGGGEGIVGPYEGSEVLGKKGDFVTSPEISQVFGELLAIYLVSRWQAAGEPSKTRLVELGPGRGTLLADVVRTLARFPKLLRTLTAVHLVEASPGLMALQANALSAALETANAKMLPAGSDEEPPQLDDGEKGVECEWFPRIEAVPIREDTWTMGVAHEFFDALPVHIFEKTDKGFREVMVDMERTRTGQSGVTILRPSDMQPVSSVVPPPPSTKLHYVLSPGPTPWSMLLADRNERFKVLQPGQRVEVSPEAWAAARRMAELVAGREGEKKREDGSVDEEVETKRKKGVTAGGAAVIVDYGDEKAFGGSFRAFKNHQIVDPLQDAGTADLTANVDFAHLKSAIATTDAKALGPMFQSHFLQALGLEPRVEALVKAATSPQRSKDIEQGAKRLVDPMGMGAQYKVLGIEAGPSAAGGEKQEQGEEKVYPFEM